MQSIELEPHAQLVGINQVKDLRNNRIMTLADAQRLGLARVDKKGQQTTKSYSAFRSNIELAINKGVIDGNGEKISLEDAIRARIVDIAQLKYVHPKTREAVDLNQAANVGLIDVTLAETLPKGVTHPATGEKLSIQRAIDAGIINPRTGEVFNPYNKQRVSWIDLTKPVYNAIAQGGISRLSFAEALGKGQIDVARDTFTDESGEWASGWVRMVDSVLKHHRVPLVFRHGDVHRRGCPKGIHRHEQRGVG